MAETYVRPTHSCSIDGCDTVESGGGRGMCRKHYTYWYRRRPSDVTCAADGCAKPPYSAGYCAAHRNRINRHGSPNINLRQRRDRIVNRYGYVLVYRPEHPAAAAGKVAEHRLVMEETLGRLLLPGENVHHKNGVRHDNRPRNLELWVTLQPAGQRPADLVVWAKEILARYN